MRDRTTEYFFQYYGDGDHRWFESSRLLFSFITPSGNWKSVSYIQDFIFRRSYIGLWRQVLSPTQSAWARMLQIGVRAEEVLVKRSQNVDSGCDWCRNKSALSRGCCLTQWINPFEEKKMLVKPHERTFRMNEPRCSELHRLGFSCQRRLTCFEEAVRKPTARLNVTGQ